MSQESASPAIPLFGDRPHRIAAVGTAALLLAAFAPTLAELVREWLERPEYSHGFLMPPVAAWLIWNRRKDLAALTPRPSLLGALMLVGSLGILLLGEMKLSWFLKPYALIGALAGGVWALYGWRALLICLPALGALFLMCPLPGRIQNGLTLPLKNSAATLATGLLHVTGVTVSLEGNMIHLPGIDSLWVADACSGIRSLISLVSVALLGIFFWERHWILRLVVLVSAVPIAIFVNGLRIWLTGFLSVNVDPETAQGFFHFFEGFAMFALAAALLWGWAMLLGYVFPKRKAAA